MFESKIKFQRFCRYTFSHVSDIVILKFPKVSPLIYSKVSFAGDIICLSAETKNVGFIVHIDFHLLALEVKLGSLLKMKMFLKTEDM